MLIKTNKKHYEIHNFYIFILGVLILKIMLMGSFSSDYQNQLFVPFIDGFLQQLYSGTPINPYEFFKSEPALFPYPPAMLFIECIGGTLSMIAGEYLILKNIAFKFPNLIFDCLGMYYLMKMFPGKRKYIGILYFSSPIIIYSTYMHGQLDIIPTSLLIGAIAYLTIPKYRNDKKYVLLLAAAVACKLHILAIMPILLMFSAKRDGWKKAFCQMSMVLLLVFVCVFPFWGEGLVSNVFFNNEQSVLTKITIDFINIQLYVPILAVLFIYLHVFIINKINKDLLYSLCGILFSVFLVLVPPMPGWYVWIVPFITIFFIDIRSDRYSNLVVYALLNLAYLLYFLIAHKTSYVDLYYFTENLTFLKSNNPIIINGLFTLMTTSLLYSIYMMYLSGVASNSLYKRRNRPFTIGVSGDSGSGKSTFLLMMESIFGKKNILLIEGDGDHKWERGNAMWEHFTHLNPKSNYLYRQAQDLSALRAGQSIIRVDYNHDTGMFSKKNKIRPKPYIILCGLHSLYLPQVRNNLDLKIYMDIDEVLRQYWKIQRDTQKRGYSTEKILKQIQDRSVDAEKYIHPQKKYADLVIHYFDKDLKDSMMENHIVNLSLKITVNMEIDLEALIQKVENYGIKVYYDYNEDLKKQSVIFEGKDLEHMELPIPAMAEEIVPRLEEMINGPLEVVDGLHGILEIVLLLLISRKMQGDDSYV